MLNALWVPIIYVFFPETAGLELEDVDYIFEAGGVTGGVWGAPGGEDGEAGGAKKGMAWGGREGW